MNLLTDYVSRSELAKQLGNSERTLIRWEEQRKGPPVTRVGRAVLYHVPTVLDWLQSQGKPMTRARARRR
jgi:hypothetical protein